MVLEVAPQYWQTPDGLKDIYFTPSRARRATRDQHDLAAGYRDDGADQHHAAAGQPHRAVPVGHGFVQPGATGMSLSDATREIDQMEQQLGMPATVRGFFAGTLQAYQQSLATEPILVITALLAVYIVLGILMRAWCIRSPSSPRCPRPASGAMLALMLFKIDLNVISIIGIILLIGIVKKNAIMMIDFALQAEREEGKSTHDAIFEACMLRFRPI